MCQNLQVQVEKLKSVNESFNLSIEELYKAHALVEATLRERDEKISVLQKKLRLLEEQSKVFHEVCLYMHDPPDLHLNALKRIFCYVRGTLDYDLQLHISFTTRLSVYTDADGLGVLLPVGLHPGTVCFLETIFYHGLRNI
nr:hypothetical protein [Tanacetum cinerariifolium]